MSAAAIPIENVYFMFCYAWNKFREAQSISVGSTTSPNLQSLLARVLLSGTNALIRRGLDRGYQLHAETIGTVRGRIELSGSIRLRARQAQKLHCEYDELTHEVLHNQVLKASLRRLSRAPGLDADLANHLRATVRRMENISDIWLDRGAFSRIQLHRNTAHYELLMKVAELAFNCLLPQAGGQGFVFQDVLHNEHQMSGVFEAFVRNFYAAEAQAHGYEESSLSIRWDAETVFHDGAGRLPRMRADVFLSGPVGSIIIDTKYYAKALQTYHGNESFHSSNLYQIFTYLKNAAAEKPELRNATGMLLYPQVHTSLNSEFRIQGHTVKIATVDLAQPWEHITQRLLNLLAAR